MKKQKVETDIRTQRQKFIDKARELETDDEGFDRVLRAIATAPKGKTPAPKSKK